MSHPDSPTQSRACPRRSSRRRRLWVQPLAVGCAAALLSGCFKATFVSDPSASNAAHAESFWQHEFIYGLIGSAELDLRDVCAGSDAHIETGGNVLTTAVSLVSAGIYTPRTVFVRCQAAARSAPSGTETSSSANPSSADPGGAASQP